MRSAHSGLSSSLRTSIARTSRAKISASRESSIRGILWKTPASSVPPSVARKWRCTCRLIRSPKVWMVNPLGMARWAESPCPAREHNEPLLGAVGTSDAGEPAFRIAAVKILLDHLLNDRSEKPTLIRFAPEDCKALTPARNDSHTQSGTCRNDGTEPCRGPSAPDVWDDRIPP